MCVCVCVCVCVWEREREKSSDSHPIKPFIFTKNRLEKLKFSYQYFFFTDQLVYSPSFENYFETCRRKYLTCCQKFGGSKPKIY